MDKETIFKRWFSDYLNPTYDELRAWMEDPAAFEPIQDWDLITGDANSLPMFVNLAIKHGPQRATIVHILYVSTANAFYHDRSRILEGINLVPDNTFADLLTWKAKARHLLDTFAGYTRFVQGR